MSGVRNRGGLGARCVIIANKITPIGKISGSEEKVKADEGLLTSPRPAMPTCRGY